MTRRQIVDALEEYRRPGSPVFAYHFRRLPSEILRKRNVPVLLGILEDDDLPARVREHAAGALGEIGDRRAVRPLIDALGKAKLRRGAATALGRMKAREATERLQELAPRVGAARWALSQVSTPGTAREAIDDLQTGQLREIGPKIRKLTPRQARSVSRELCARLAEIVSRGSLSHDHRWIVTALQYLAPAEAAEALTHTLAQAIDLDGCCGCLRNRAMRALGGIRPPQAIPVLVDVICEVGNHAHKQLAAVCIEKIVAEGGAEALSLLLGRSRRLADELQRLEREAALTPSVRPQTPWDRAAGTPRWSQACARATRAIARLLDQHAGA